MSELVEDTMADDLAAAFEEVESSEESEDGGESSEITESSGESDGGTDTAGAGHGDEDGGADSGDRGDSKADEISGEADDSADEQKDREHTEGPAAPQSWSPGNREHWAKLPSEVREQVAKREKENDTVMREASQARQFSQAFQEAVAPYRDTISIEAGGDALAATRNLMNIATGLRVGSTQQKAQLVQNIIDTYGVDIGALDDLLTAKMKGQPAPQGQPQQQAAPVYDPRVNDLIQERDNRAAADQQEIDETTRAFLTDPKNEFASDLSPDMADLMEFAGRRGKTLTLQEAYDQAVKMSPEIQTILTRRGAGGDNPNPGNGTSSADSLKRKKRAAETIRGSSSGDQHSRAAAGTSMEDDVSAAVNELMGG